jgi:hypothetical protein
MTLELPRIDYGEFQTIQSDFAEFYRDDEGQMPRKMPEPRGKSVPTTAFVDAAN